MSSFKQAVEAINSMPRRGKKALRVQGYTNVERLALIALDPFLEAIGGRIAEMLDMAVEGASDEKDRLIQPQESSSADGAKQ